MKTSFLFTCLILLVCTTGCKKGNDQSNNGNPDQPGQATGTIILPAGSSIDVNKLSVLAPYKVSPVKDSKFDLGDSTSNYSPTFVTDASGKLVLAGYVFDHKTDKDITVTSTALMLLMNTDLVRAISDSGKKALIPKFIKNKDFPALEAEISKLVLSGKDILDTTNLDLLNRLDAVLQRESSNKLTQKYIPVGFTRDGRVLNFYSDDNIFTTVIGFYKEGQKLDQLAVDGHQVYPNSLVEAAEGVGMALSGRSTESQTYTLQGDGKFDIKMRTGLGHNDGSAEYSSADRRNAISLLAYLLSIVVPIVDRKYLSCAENAALLTKETLELTNTGDIARLRLSVSSKDFAETIKQCTGSDGAYLAVYQATQHKYLQFLDRFKLFKVTGALANTAFYLAQWNRANPFFDTCFVARGSHVLKCNLQYDGLSDEGSSTFLLGLEAAAGEPIPPGSMPASMRLGYAYLLFNNDNATAEFDAVANFTNTPRHTSLKFSSNVPRQIDFDGQSLKIDFDNGSFTGNVVNNDIVGTFNLYWAHPDFKSNLKNGYPPISISMPLTLHLHPNK